MRIYVASSWRNLEQPAIVLTLRNAGHQVYDFREPEPGLSGFAWTDIDPDWQAWSPQSFRSALEHPIAVEGYRRDITALTECDACVLVLPCGRSAHLELGYAAGAGKRTLALLADGEPELMLSMVDELVCTVDELVAAFANDAATPQVITVPVSRLGYKPIHYAELVADALLPATHWGAACVSVPPPIAALCGAVLNGATLAVPDEYMERSRLLGHECRSCARVLELTGRQLDRQLVGSVKDLAAQGAAAG